MMETTLWRNCGMPSMLTIRTRKVTRALTNFIESSKDDTVEAEDMRQLCITVVKLLGPEGNTQPIRDWLGDAGTPMSRKSRVSLQSMTRSDLKLETYHQLK